MSSYMGNALKAENNRPARLPRPIVIGFKILAFVAALFLAALAGHIKIWAVAQMNDHPGTILIAMGAIVAFIIIYNVVKLVPPEHLSQKKWPSTNRGW